MTTLNHQIRIEAPPAVVWRALADLTAVANFNPGVSSARSLSEQREGVGAGRRCELKPKGWVEERVWQWEPERALGLEVSASDWPIVFMKWKTELSADGPATLVNQRLDYALKFGPVGALMDALVMRRKLDRSVSDIFRGLKRYAESSAHASA